MSDVTRPRPDLTDPMLGPFWRACREGRLVFQRCRTCGYLRWPPAPVCPECLRPGGSWTEVEPVGTVWSMATYEHCYHPAFAADIPYTVALVELDAGPRLITNLVSDEDTVGAGIGSRVEAVFDDVDEEATLVKFRACSREGSA